MRRMTTLLLSGTLGLVCCASRSIYAPVVTTNATVAGVPAVDYPIPSPSATGDIRLAALGIANVHPAAAPTTTAKAVRLRMIATNRSEGTWSVLTREQRLALGGAVVLGAGDGIADHGASPLVVNVAPGQTRTIDLVFLLPPAFQAAANRPAFDLLWAVHTPTRTFEQRTPFDRVARDLYYEDIDDVTGRWGGSSSPSR